MIIKTHQLKKSTEGDPKPKGETSSQGREETAILQVLYSTVSYHGHF